MKLKTLLLGAAALSAFGPAAAFAERGSDGHVNVFYWQAPSSLNPYLSGGTKDIEAASLILEPLGRFDETGAMVPFLATEIPTIENGGVSEDLTSITWTLKEGLLWSDGTPLTSADVKFTADYCMDEDGGCAQGAKYDGVASIETPDERTIVVTFDQPTPNPYGPFMGALSPILQQAQFADCMGAAASTCTDQNFGPIGTGPFVVDEFRTNDVISMSANPNYRDPAKPAFATLTLKGGGTAEEAARAVLQTGEFDYSWNLQLAPDVLEDMASAGKGKVVTAFGTLVERIEMNLTDPSPDLPEGERSTAAHPHPILSDQKVRKALSMAIDRNQLNALGYGETGRPTCDLVPGPELFAAKNTDCLTQDIEGAKALLDEAGWTDSDGDGIRDKDGKPLNLLFQTSVNQVRDTFQRVIQAWWKQIGVDTEIVAHDGSVFFGGDAGNPYTFQKFYADVEMYANNFDGTDPQRYLAGYTCGAAPKPSSQWQGENINRYCDEEYDALVDELANTGELEKRGELAKTLNTMLTADSYTIVPLIDRGRVSAHSNTLGGVVINSWDSEIWNAADWFRIDG